jgi:hypothetical protein
MDRVAAENRGSRKTLSDKLTLTPLHRIHAGTRLSVGIRALRGANPAACRSITETLSCLWRAWKRQAVERNLRHYQNVERAIFARIYRRT